MQRDALDANQICFGCKSRCQYFSRPSEAGTNRTKIETELFRPVGT